MNMLSIWPTLVILGLTILILSPKRAFSFLDTAPVAHQHRLDSIDGLRGILASAVVFHHFVMTAYNMKQGTSGLPPSPFYAFIGPGAVSIFFMITGYLFWGRLLDRQGNIKWLELYINRAFRIYPLYLLLIVAYFIFVIRHVGIATAQTHGETVAQLSQWLFFGLVNQPIPFLNHPEYLGVVGQTWSLHYEWLFYMSLPLLAIVAREKATVAITASTLIVLLFGSGVVDDLNVVFIEHFVIGMLTASLLRSYPKLRGHGVIRSVFAIVAVASAIFLSGSPYSKLGTVLLGISFFLVASGASVFGILTASGTKRLGNVSYSIYLLHGLVINILMQFPRYNANLVFTVQRFWLVTFLTYGFIIAISIATYYVIERGGIRLGRRVIQHLPTSATRSSSVLAE
ncbi:acyltransferase family protein [Paraburkholderia sp. RL17-373-BIF-A]|uniref:acyltransferase family protein n=1 Tax=Paraburkholderia sp. RL17-373-BIF-A TaxID=3031629 RepID=UPI0038BD090A